LGINSRHLENLGEQGVSGFWTDFPFVRIGRSSKAKCSFSSGASDVESISNQAESMKDMQEVAHHLQKTAHSMAGFERDAFARSAYNRYYYACYLEVRDAFREMSAEWGRSAHKSFPEILRSSISKTLKSGRRAANRVGDAELERQIDQALRGCAELASIIEKANGARIIADYSPEIVVGFDGSTRFSLNGIEITEAHEWYGRVRVLVRQILSAWRQVNA
jgi:hypothetical protein